MNEPLSLEELARRLEAVERQNRLTGALAVALVLGAVLVATLGQATVGVTAQEAGRVVEAERFVLRDRCGVTRAELAMDQDHPVLRMFSATGALQVTLKGSVEPLLRLATADKDSTIVLSTAQSGAILVVNGGEGNPCVGIDADKMSASMAVYDGANNKRALVTFGTTLESGGPRQSGGFCLYDPGPAPLAVLSAAPSPEGGPVMLMLRRPLVGILDAKGDVLAGYDWDYWRALEYTVRTNCEGYLTEKLIRKSSNAYPSDSGGVRVSARVDTDAQPTWLVHLGSGRFSVSDREVRAAYQAAGLCVFNELADRFYFGSELKPGEVEIRFTIRGFQVGTWRGGTMTLEGE